MRPGLLLLTLPTAALLAACSTTDLASPSGPAQQVRGQLQAITPPTLIVGGQVVTTTSATVVRRGGMRIDLGGLHVGEPLQVQGAVESGDTVSANEIDADSNEVEFHGTVDSIVAPLLWVSGRTVATDSATRITRGEDTPITLADLQAGDTVRVEGAVQPDSSILAHRIEVSQHGEGEEEGGHEAEADLHGTIDSISAPDFFVGGHTIVTDSATLIERGGQYIALSDLAVGDTVEVEGVTQADSSVLARRIEVGGEGTGEHAAYIELRGPVDSVVAPDLFVSDHTVVTDSETIFVRGDQHITLGDLAVGDTVAVNGTVQADSSILARMVEVATGEGDGEH